MGRTIEVEATERGHEIVLAIAQINSDLGAEVLKNADVAIEFTQPDAVVSNIYKCFEAGIPVVVGTTGWYERYDEVSKKCLDSNGTLFTATNFSIGVNIFYALNSYLSKIMDGQLSYKVRVEETHHIQKKDAPSGTAISLAEQITANHKGYNGWGLEGRDSMGQGIIPIGAHRIDDVPGLHEVKYNNAVDEITIRHNAFTRKGFAQGAIIAAEWVAGKKGVYTMGDMLKF